MSFPSRCKSCDKKIQFNLNDKIQDILYCDDKCWESDWLATGNGLIHPKHKNTILKFPKTYGGRIACDKVFNLISGIKGIEG